ncbi:MAG: hypothetical protein A2Y03_10170 [Omnitrophica WOR_2 bacterium GWF2_38_59]|nr:MAG: hypothetical protein A2Y03_10170 [Omnitrophica WOR_2 bacterium GWF2_38_59]OGX57648.1 MAG: hypothetical protein A2306_07515 [Omnitrophica WOR_2 bacterium RIFOXYB2_FULL_38_16]
MSFSKNIIKSVFFLICVSLFFQTLGYAQPGGPKHPPNDGPRHHERPPVGFHRPSLPETILEFVVGGIRLFYDDGVYYRREGNVYIVIEPPIGAVVRVIPSYYQEIIINGVIYYTYDRVYYVRVRKGYEVVQPPVVTVVQPASVVLTQTVQATDGVLDQSSEDEFTVNIPNNKGGYIPVVIKKTKDGFIGPQGEFYPEFPRVSQLKVMYGTQAK